jgi:FkbM family methyltransferase
MDWNKLTRYSNELSFVIRNGLDWPSRIRLLKNTLLFHLNNGVGRSGIREACFLVRFRVGAYRDIPVTLRPFAGDIFVLFEVLMDQCYNIPDVMLAPDKVDVIMDCGANIGITSLFLASRYPNARIYSIEPNEENFELLSRNTAVEPRIVPIHGAIVGYPRKSARLTTGRAAWGNVITKNDEGVDVPAFTVEQICQDHQLSCVDLLKVDVEGAEKGIFANSSFLRGVGFIIIELHNDYSLEHFSHDIAARSFVAVKPGTETNLKMICARPEGGLPRGNLLASGDSGDRCVGQNMDSLRLRS